jgi:hypothetical protein
MGPYRLGFPAYSNSYPVHFAMAPEGADHQVSTPQDNADYAASQDRSYARPLSLSDDAQRRRAAKDPGY